MNPLEFWHWLGLTKEVKPAVINLVAMFVAGILAIGGVFLGAKLNQNEIGRYQLVAHKDSHGIESLYKIDTKTGEISILDSQTFSRPPVLSQRKALA